VIVLTALAAPERKDSAARYVAAILTRRASPFDDAAVN